jgi:hypothetical protein
MRVPRVRFTVRRMMVVIATLAVSWCILEGIGHLSIYPANTSGERNDRETAAALEKKNDVIRAAEYRRSAEEIGRRNQDSWSHILTALSLIGLGLISKGLDLTIRHRYGTRIPDQNGKAKAFAAACSTVATVMLAGLVIGGIGYLAAMAYVFLTME